VSRERREKFMSISKKLRQLREDREKTQREVAEALGIKEQVYQRYEYGTREPKIDIIRKLAKYYNISADEILEIK
jgi:transcriptional regulator with XRE-family HTH domain